MKKNNLILTIVVLTIILFSTSGYAQTVTIGTQVWTSKNLNVSTYRNGDVIPQVQVQKAWANLTTGAWCYYGNDASNGTKYGKLYNWFAVNDPRGLAPQGWHVPSDAEWTILETALGGSSVAGGGMKEAGTLNWTTPNTGGNNNSGFAGLPGGTRSLVGPFEEVGGYGYWWSSTENLSTSAWCRGLGYDGGSVDRYGGSKQHGFSVRCLRD